MKKRNIIFGIISFILVFFKLLNINIAIDKEINIYKYLSFISSNLYDDIQSVSSTKVEVFDYEIKNNNLYIETINNEVRLPINGMVTEVKDNYIIIHNHNNYYKINNINNLKFHLYQHYKNNLILGYSDNIIIEANDYNTIVSGLIINYEKI
ncbi:MAG: hypothetical protein IJY14_02220 [Acholeplasmatales bacterium]|nr:hypothetical protein [Acholeplasmatales bacterium]